MQAVEHFIKQFVPEHYDLFLDLSRETKTFLESDHHWSSTE